MRLGARVGKRVHGALYLHRDATKFLVEVDRDRLQTALQIVSEAAWNVARIEPKVVGLLLYDEFDSRAFPRLLLATRVDLEKKTAATRDHRNSANPLILHRKELLVGPDDPRRDAWAALSARLAALGLFGNPSRIGHQQQWTEMLLAAGVDSEGAPAMNDAIQVHRHRTAMVRYTLSKPMGLLIRHGIVRPATTVFDYGCGQGDDLKALGSQGISATGWDPHFAPHAARQAAQVVNLGFVLNVIENPAERRQALYGAWKLTEKVLSVAVMIAGQVPVDGLRPYGDGYLTSRGTFQKYFQHAELRAFIAEVTGSEPVSITTGTFFVFRRTEDQQEFLLDRRRGSQQSTAAFAGRERVARQNIRIDVAEKIPTAVDEITKLALHRGRFPHSDELSALSNDELSAQHVSFARAIEACRQSSIDENSLTAAATLRRDDLLVHHALGVLNRSRSLQNPGSAIVRDIRAHFGSQRELMDQAKKYLFALADGAALHELCVDAAEKNIGTLDDKERLVLHGANVNDLPGPLRCYFGCAAYLSGEPDGPFIVRFDPRKKNVKTFLIDNERFSFPTISSSVTVDLRRQKVFAKPEALRLIRKSAVFGVKASTRRLKAESSRLAELGLPASRVFETFDANVKSDATR